MILALKLSFGSLQQWWRKPNLRFLPMGILVILGVALELAGCSTVPAQSSPIATAEAQWSDDDPWEPFNRKVTAFNDQVDAILAKPLAQAYVELTPNIVRTGVSNFFNNLTGLSGAFNHLLQGNLRYSAEGLIRVSVNTVFGLGGVVDVASELKVDRHKADFGQTLGKWGVPTGPYVVVPLMGPTTLRDSLANAALPQDEILRRVSPESVRYSLYAVRAVEQRANLLRATKVMDEAALDSYSFTRDVFLQVRRNQVNGDPAEESASDQAPADLPK